VNGVSLTAAGVGSPLLRSCLPLPLAWWERKGVGGKVRAALTPSPAPALRERGDWVRERGIVERRRIATARPISPLLSSSGSGRGLGGKVRELKRWPARPLDSRNQPTTHRYLLFEA
jgi:hypothetical protein